MRKATMPTKQQPKKIPTNWEIVTMYNKCLEDGLDNMQASKETAKLLGCAVLRVKNLVAMLKVGRPPKKAGEKKAKASGKKMGGK
jgi:hypothetical protein